MTDRREDQETEAAFENLEKWKQFENMEFTRTYEREKWKPRERTAEDEEIDACTFEWLDMLFKTKNIEILGLPEIKKEIYLAQKLNERHYRLMKENEQAYCTFFMKTGACRYGMQCKRIHIIPLCSETILIDHMYKDSFNKMKNVTKGLDDSLLEIDEDEMQKAYEEFYNDVFAEWSKFGKIVQFKCCNNLMQHLRGNVFIQYENVESAILAKANLDGRFYGGYPLKINFSLIKDWKQAICAYNGPEMSSCPKYSECNFLHVYKNPRNEFPLERRSNERGERKGRRFDNNNNNNNFRRRYSPPKDKKLFVRQRSGSKDKGRERENRGHRDNREHREHRDHREHREHRKHSRERKDHHKRRDHSRSRSEERKKKSHKKRSHSRDKNRSRSKDHKKNRKHSSSGSKSPA